MGMGKYNSNNRLPDLRRSLRYTTGTVWQSGIYQGEPLFLLHQITVHWEQPGHKRQLIHMLHLNNTHFSSSPCLNYKLIILVL
jgi:hypothetical protein